MVPPALVGAVSWHLLRAYVPEGAQRLAGQHSWPLQKLRGTLKRVGYKTPTVQTSTGVPHRDHWPGGCKLQSTCSADVVALSLYSPCALLLPLWRVKVTCPVCEVVACGWNLRFCPFIYQNTAPQVLAELHTCSLEGGLATVAWSLLQFEVLSCPECWSVVWAVSDHRGVLWVPSQLSTAAKAAQPLTTQRCTARALVPLRQPVA